MEFGSEFLGDVDWVNGLTHNAPFLGRQHQQMALRNFYRKIKNGE